MRNRGSQFLLGILFLFAQWTYAKESQSIKILFDQPIDFDTKLGASFNAKVNGKPAKFILDTASYPVIFSEKFSNLAGLKYDKKEPPLTIAWDSLSIQIDSLTIQDVPFAVAPSEKNAFAGGEYSGLFSPYLVELGQNRSLILDFPGKRFFGIEAEDKVRHNYLDCLYKGYTKIEFPYKRKENSAPELTAYVEGKKEVPVILTTGRGTTAFRTDYMKGEEVARKGRAISFEGQITKTVFSAPKKVYLGDEWVGKMEIEITDFKNKGEKDADRVQEYVGNIGLDILKHCTMVIEDTSDKMALFCQTPATEKSVPK